MRTFVIGDIHGGLRALQQVLKQARVLASDRLIFLGDYVDGWSESAQVMNYILDLSSKHECIFLKGNHDVFCESWLRSGIADPSWFNSGGQSTIDSYREIATAQRQLHLQFLEQMKLYHIDEKNRLFIHAGFSSMSGPKQEYYTEGFTWDRTLWEMVLALDPGLSPDSIFYPRRLKLFNQVFIGHTPTVNHDIFYPMKRATVWNIDTGAAFNGKLSMINADTEEIWQSDILQDLYPGECGRNSQ